MQRGFVCCNGLLGVSSVDTGSFPGYEGRLVETWIEMQDVPRAAKWFGTC
jgi:hypothetical protein